LAITDRAYIMYEGEILVSGSSAEIANDDNARRFYLGERFSMSTEVRNEDLNQIYA